MKKDITKIFEEVKVKLVICKMMTQRSQNKKMICYCRNLDKLIFK